MRCAVTGAFGYSGRYIAGRLLEGGDEVTALTNSPRRRNPFGEKVPACPFHFDEPERLTAALRGIEVLINTYWVRFDHRDFTHADAVRNSLTMFDCAAQAGVRRVVHVSITNPSKGSDLGYFRGKAILEEALIASDMQYAILRPAVLFGGEDILINNIAWLLRHFPVFGVFGDGRYKLQPIHVGDLAALAAREAAREENAIIEAIGPETFEYRELVSALGRIIGKPRPILSVPPWLGYLAGKGVGVLKNDVVLTRDEITGLMRNLLFVDAAPAGEVKLTDWARENAASLGVRYASELGRRRDREKAYRFT